MLQVVLVKTDQRGMVHQIVMPIGKSSSGNDLCRVIDARTGVVLTTRERTPNEEAVVRRFTEDRKPAAVYRYQDGPLRLGRELSSSEHDALEKLLATGRSKVVFLESHPRLDSNFSGSAPTAAASGWGRPRLSKTPPLAWQGY